MRTALVCAAMLALAPTALAQSPAAESPSAPAQMTAAGAILVDLDTSRVLFQRAVHTPMPVASLTKIVTALVVRDRYTLDDVVTVTDAVDRVGGGKLGLTSGMQMTVRELLNAMLVVSANDAAVALAVHDPAGEQDFLGAMNAKAASLGASQTHLLNPHGLDQPGHVSTAWDLAILSRALLDDPVLRGIVGTVSFTLAWPDGTQRVLRNHNKLLGRTAGAFGVKTGYTNDAGRCLVAAVQSPAGRALAVVLHSNDHYADVRALLALYGTQPSASGTLPAARRARVTSSAAGRSAREPASSGGIRWIALPSALLAGAMLLTVRPGRRWSPLREAAQFHPYLEPLAVAEDIRPPPAPAGI